MLYDDKTKWMSQWELWNNAQMDVDFELALQVVAEVRAVKLQYGLTKQRPAAILKCNSPGFLSRYPYLSQYSHWLRFLPVK